jgi:hypothetical protein
MKKIYILSLSIFAFFFWSNCAFSQTSQTFTASTTWVCPAGVTSVQVEAWGGGGGGGGTALAPSTGGGGAGGAYAKDILSVVPGTSYTINIGGGGAGGTNIGGTGATGGNSWFGTVSTVFAKGGAGGVGGVTGTPIGTGATGTTTGSIGSTLHAGGSGSNAAAAASGAGGGGAGSAADGGNATGTTAGTGGVAGGGAGAAGRTTTGAGTAAPVSINATSGGGSGGYRTNATARAGGAGAQGKVILTISCPAANIPYTENFDAYGALPSCSSIQDANADGTTMIVTTTNPSSAPYALGYSYNTNSITAADDWWFTPGLNMTMGTSYVISFKYRISSATFPESIELKTGTLPNAASMEAAPLFAIVNDAVNVAYKTITLNYTPTATGVQYFGWHINSAADENYILIDDISITIPPVQFTSAASGDWSNPATWTNGVVPSCTDNVSILNSHNVTVSTAGNVSKTLTVNSGGSLTVSAGDVTVGCSLNNSSFVNSGSFSISGGTISINGSMLSNLGSTFTQTGGNIIEDGNAGGVVANSVASGTPLVTFNPTNLTSVNLTGGTFTIVDPHTSASGTFSLYVSGTTIGALNVTKNHTFRFGNGTSVDAGGNSAYGFRIDLWEASSGLPLGNVVVEGPAGTNRFVGSQYQAVVLGDVAVNNGGEIRTGNIYTGGNITANTGATITTTSTTAPSILLANVTYDPVTDANLSITNNTVAQSINGPGTYRNSATTVTANTVTLSVQNTASAGVTLNIPFSLSSGLQLVAGNLNTSSANLLTVGYNAANAGTITRTAGMVNGPLKKWIAASVASTLFPVGDGVNYKPATIAFTTAPTTGGTLTANWSSAPPSFPNAVPLTEGANIVNSVSKNGSWFINAADGLAGGAYTTTVTANGATGIIDYTKAVLIKRPSAGGDWTLDGTPVANTGSNTAPTLSRTGMIGFSEFAIGGEAGVVLPISVEYFRGSKQAAGNVLDWKVSSTSTATLTLERSTDRVNYKGINAQAATPDRMLAPFTYTDAAPAAGINYYRLKITNADGESKYSNVVALINKEKGFELISIAPNPVQHSTVLSLSSAKAGKVELSVSDATGKVVMKQSVSVIAGNNPITLNFAALASGTYQITAVNADGDSKSTRFVRL